jgi:hypothetical protein
MASDDRINRRREAGRRTARPARNSRPAFDEALLQRVYGEFLEMPGLRLTSQQAQRLLGLDESICAQLLQFLVDAKFLSRAGHGMYTRLTDGYSPRPRTAKARFLEDSSRTKKKAV